jgi:hypothetical protein
MTTDSSTLRLSQEEADWFAVEVNSFEYDDCPYHAPSAFVEASRLERERQRKRDLTDLQDTWRDEMRQRKRENAARYLRCGNEGRRR